MTCRHIPFCCDILHMFSFSDAFSVCILCVSPQNTRTRKLQSNHISYNTSMDACARDSHWPEALYLLRPSGAAQMEGGEMCAAFQLTFGCFVNLCKVWTVKLWWCPPASKSAPKWIQTIFGASPHGCGHYEWEQGSHKSDSAYFFFLLRFFFLPHWYCHCTFDAFSRQSLSFVGTGPKELFALNTALSAGARGAEWRFLTFIDSQASLTSYNSDRIGATFW